jgi:hypothetical protein
MRHIRRISPWSVLLAFFAAVILTTVWGAIVQTQYNLAALAGIGAELPAGLRLRTTLADIFSGFSPTYAGFIVVPSLLVAFAVAWLLAPRLPGPPMLWFAVAGALAILLGIPLVNYLSPVALLIGASRDWTCTVLMAMGGAAAGLLFERLRGAGVRTGEPAAGVIPRRPETAFTR